MTFSFRSLNCNRNRIRPRNVESTKLSNLYTQATRRVPVLHFQWNGSPFSWQRATHCATDIFQRRDILVSRKKLKSKWRKWDRRTRYPCWTVDYCLILSRKASCKLVTRIVSDVIHFLRRNVCRYCATVANVASLFPEGN